jgi:hypothetical protein
MSWGDARRHPVIYGAAIGLATGPMIGIWAASKMSSASALAIFGFWGVYTLAWIAVFVLISRIFGSASNAI